jgi:ribokinase
LTLLFAFFYIKFVEKNMKAQTSKKILVVGSSNTDMVFKTTRFPLPGETIIGNGFFMNPGGKGANQAVAAVRLGGQVSFVCKTGNDVFGHQSHQLFEEEGIDCSYLLSDPKHPSGVAMISVDSNAENIIIVASGANAHFSVKDMTANEKAIYNSDIILMQLEIPLETVTYVAEKAKAEGKKVVLNPAPAAKLSDELLRNISIITPNETEAEILTGIKVTDEASAKKVADVLIEKGIETVIITLGAKGAYVRTKEISQIVEGVKVTAIDTTAAGDVFNGALTVAIAEGSELLTAVKFACKASAISVTREGAQSSAPYRTEVN